MTCNSCGRQIPPKLKQAEKIAPWKLWDVQKTCAFTAARYPKYTKKYSETTETPKYTYECPRTLQERGHACSSQLEARGHLGKMMLRCSF